MVIRVYRYGRPGSALTPYLLVVEGDEDDCLGMIDEWAARRGARLEWDANLKIGELVGMDEVYCMGTES